MSAPQSPGLPRVTLLDCTLRDGGYYNEWDYSPELVRAYLAAMGETRVPVVELGFRSLERGHYLGPTAYTTDRFIESLEVPPEMVLGVMVNAKEFAAGGPGAVDALFAPRDRSRVSLVRLAAHHAEVPLLRPSIDRLHDLGYTVGVNLMQIASRTLEEVSEFGATLRSWGVEMAYFADSFGGMQPTDIASVVGALRSGFSGPVGCHTHDNMNLAFANTLAAIEAGASYVDATVMGMGRGPGNARTEYVALELERRGLANLAPLALLPLVVGEFADLQRTYGWGTNLYYFLSAANGVHPTYIQEMTRDGRYSVQQILGAVRQLAVHGGASFDQGRLDAAASAPKLLVDGREGTYDATGWCRGKPVLIVGPGPSAVERRADIEDYIRWHRPTVIALNPVPPVDSGLVDAYAICHPTRAVMDAERIAALDRPVFMPWELLDRLGLAPTAYVRDYGISIDSQRMFVEPKRCGIVRLAAFPYALALAAVGGATEVRLTGFDGFEPGDPRQAEMESIFRAFVGVPGAPPVTSLTRTNYPIAHSSIYAE